ncbi:MAG: cytochrome c3 family protein [ANME-2 cluster archaeon]|nr:cytochrome c3 family protein [ANME-2 cluster archaeon]
MKLSNVLLLLIVAFSLIAVVQAEEPQYETVSKMAEDVDCRATCHNPDPHVIHANTPATCQQCHGATLTDRRPACTKCHSGTIHNVHIKKVQTEDCSFCHSGLENLHLEMISDTLCSHCHKDLLVVHGGPAESCKKCHGTAPDIVAPVKGEGMTVICQNCHVSTDVAALHGDSSNPSSCYRCHRPGSTEVESSSEIPHFLHIPQVDCNKCHLNQDTGKIYIPVCTQCHKVDKLHEFKSIGLKTPTNSKLRCAVCHPMMSTDDGAGKPAGTSTPTPSKPTEATDGGSSGVPGFGIVTALTALSVLYIVNRNRD